MSTFKLCTIIHCSAQLHFQREQREHRVFQQLLDMIPGLEDRLMDGSNEDHAHIADLVIYYVLLIQH